MSQRATPIVRRAAAYEEEKPFWLFRLETWLVLAFLSLIFQIYPALFWSLLYIVDVRNWTWGVWVGVEIAVVVTLIVLRAWQYSDS